MEKEFIDLVNHVFTLQWASWALPVSILAAMVVKRFILCWPWRFSMQVQ